MGVKSLIKPAFWVEAIIIALIFVIIATFVSYGVGASLGTDLPPACEDWNKNYVMEISLFLAALLTHIGFEVVGANAWYCKNGVACSNAQ